MRKVYLGLIVALLMFPLEPGAQENALVSTCEQQKGVEITVYNNNLGLVKDTRTIELPTERAELRFMDVASHIMPVTVQVKSLNFPKKFGILEQNYEYDLMDSKKLLDKYVGKKLKIIDWNKYQDRKEIMDAVLLSNNEGPIYSINNEIYLGHPGIQVLPKIPENLIAKPTLTWLFENTSEKAHDLEVSYLTQNIDWKADYVLLINTDDTSGDLSGWITVDNQSGASYKDARLKLVAGDVNRVTDEARPAPYAARGKFRAKDVIIQGVEEKAFFEYHIYDVPRKTTIKDNQIKQISLLAGSGINIRKEFLVYGIQAYFTMQYTPETRKQPVNVYIKLKNSKENNLGMPLPGGIMRLYKQDSDGGRQFIGEDKILHTPKDEELKLKIGEAFDVAAQRIQSDFKQLSRFRYETAWEVTLRNHKDQEVSVGIVEPLPSSWEVVENSHSYSKLDAHTIRFDVKVPKDQEVTIKYRVRTGI